MYVLNISKYSIPNSLRFYRKEKVGKVSKFQERLYNDNFKAEKGEERKGKGKLSVPPPHPSVQTQVKS